VTSFHTASVFGIFTAFPSLVGTQESTTSILDSLTISAFDTPAVSTDATQFYFPAFVFSTAIKANHATISG
jgi:hypothetical protein